MSRVIRDMHTYFFLYVFYEGYTDVQENEASLRTQAYNCVLIEGLDYQKKDIQDMRTINELAWNKAAHDANLYIDYPVEIKLLGVSHDTTNI